ncbi:MAG TPA: hypothetical protein VIK28_03945 [Sedimentisphaerales bacterium]
MDLNDILKAMREGKLSGYSIAELQAMSQRCVVYIQNRIPEATLAKDSVDKEIARQETLEAEQRVASASTQRHEAEIALEREKLEHFSKIREQVATIDGRLATVEREAARSEFRTWSFWIAVISGFIALAALFRDYWGWGSPAPVSTIPHQSASPSLPQPTNTAP